MKKKFLGGLVASSFMLSLSLTAMAAENIDSQAVDEFSETLPDNQGAIEASNVQKGTTAGDFNVTIDSVTSGTNTDSVCVWAESPAGNNYSNPANQEQEGTGDTIEYYVSPRPDVGDNVVLNLSNPVNTTSNPTASGSWDAK